MWSIESLSFHASSFEDFVNVDWISWRTCFVLVSSVVEGCNDLLGLDVDGSGWRMGRRIAFSRVFLNCIRFFKMDHDGSGRWFRLGRWTVRGICLSRLVGSWGGEKVWVSLLLTMEANKPSGFLLEAWVGHSKVVDTISFDTKIVGLPL